MKFTTLETAEQVPFSIDGRKMFTSANAELIHLTLKPNEKIESHTNPFDVVFYVIEGTGCIRVENESVDVSANNTLHVSAGLQRGMCNTGDTNLRVLVVKLFG